MIHNFRACPDDRPEFLAIDHLGRECCVMPQEVVRRAPGSLACACDLDVQAAARGGDDDDGAVEQFGFVESANPVLSGPCFYVGRVGAGGLVAMARLAPEGSTVLS